MYKPSKMYGIYDLIKLQMGCDDKKDIFTIIDTLDRSSLAQKVTF